MKSVSISAGRAVGKGGPAHEKVRRALGLRWYRVDFSAGRLLSGDEWRDPDG